MKESEINIVIAETCGFKWHRWGDHPQAPLHLLDPELSKDPRAFVPCVRFDKNEPYRSDSMPNYCQNLNAMHEATWYMRKNLGQFTWLDYSCILFNVVCGRNPEHEIPHGATMWGVINATAYQRAEAFVRTVGKWKEDE